MCVTTNDLPCIQCVTQSMSSKSASRFSARSSRRSSAGTISGNNGGDDSGQNGGDNPDIFYCGDGRVSANEECDDGNEEGGDGCTSRCKLEAFIGLCSGNECAEGGNDVCGAFGLTCAGTNDLPCIQCVNNDEPVEAACNGRSCTAGGSNICNDYGMSCMEDSENPCFVCEATYVVSSVQSVQTSTIMNCRGTECSEGGNNVCNAFGLSCTQSGDLPCISCVNSVGIVVEPSCAKNGCEIGGSDVCGAQGLGCRARTTGACFECTNKEGTTVAIASPFICGNGIQELGEDCDEGLRNSNVPTAVCRTNCRTGGCGDGILDTPLEICDDGNTQSGDGCSAVCAIERNAPDTATLPGQIIELPFMQGNGNALGSVTYPSSVAPTTPVPPSSPDTGPAALAVMAAGAAAGYSWMRRKRS